jgi:tryptophan halogenase
MKIVIAGGGTAGWISAYIIEKTQPGVHDITLIESSSIGIIGAGEGSTGALYDLVLGLYFHETNIENIAEFMEFTDSTPKYGIKHINWTADANSSYFAPIEGSVLSGTTPDLLFHHALATFGATAANLSSFIGQAYSLGKRPNEGFGMHFDAFKVGQYFKKKLEPLSNVKSYDAVITNVAVSEDRAIDSVLLDNGMSLTADFFLDCTGFSRVLISKLSPKWNSYKENLLTNTAMPFLVDYKESSITKVEPLTTAQALSSGWMWNIPLKTRMGCGYVYNREFLSQDEAQEEVERTLGHPITPIRTIPFDAGSLDETWISNCMAVGLSSVFLEPLEATSIHTTITQMLTFSLQYLSPRKETTLTKTSISSFNKKMTGLYEDYRDFLILHYQGGRTDSEFWRTVTNEQKLTPFVEEILDKSKYLIPGALHYEERWGASTTLWNWILAGTGFITPKVAADSLAHFGKTDAARIMYEDFAMYAENSVKSQPSFDLLK